MNYLEYFQWVLNAAFGFFLLYFWIRLRRPPQEDPRMSRGLQLLQSKIAVLEDLSDRTEIQYAQLTQLLEEKQKALQSKIFNSENQIRKIDAAIQKSLEVANLFQDRIPHKDVIERKNTLKYIEAAQLAHQGMSVEDISSKVDLPIAEVEMIVKVNREELVFKEDTTPKWAQKNLNVPENLTALNQPIVNLPTEEKPRHESLKKLGEEFRLACEQFDANQAGQNRLEQRIEDTPKQILSVAKKVTHKIVEKFEFPVLGLQQRVKSQDHDATE